MSKKQKPSMKFREAVRFLKSYRLHVRHGTGWMTGRSCCWCFDIACSPFRSGAPASNLPGSILRAEMRDGDCTVSAWLCGELVGVYTLPATCTIRCAAGREFDQEPSACRVYLDSEQVKALAEKIETLITFS